MTKGELLEQIAAEVRPCTNCGLYQGTKHAVPGAGNPEAEVMFIGEGPGFNEDRQGLPFVGPAGTFLNELLREAGLTRAEVFITNVVKHRPPENRDPLPEEIAACSGYLTRQIAAIDPKVIVTLGRYSMARFFPDAKISRIHGQYKVVDGRVVVPMYHPAAALRTDAVKRAAFEDFRTALPAAIALARQLAAQGKLGNATQSAKPAKEDDQPPQQLSLF